MIGNDEGFDPGALPDPSLEEFLLAAGRAGEPGLEESEFRKLAAAVTSAIVSASAIAPSRKAPVFERIVELCGEGNTNEVVREELHRLAGRLLADLPPDVQSQFVTACLQRLNQDLLGEQNTRSWRPVAYVLAANYSLIKSRDLRRQLIEKLTLLIHENPAYKNDFFIEDLLLIHQKMRLGKLEELKEMLDLRHAGEKRS